MSIEHKPGDVIDWGGTASFEGITDFTGYTLKCQFRNPKTWAIVATADIDWVGPVNIPTPALLIHVDAADTALWPENSTLVFDVTILTPMGDPLTTETYEFNTAKRVTALP